MLLCPSPGFSSNGTLPTLSPIYFTELNLARTVLMCTDQYQRRREVRWEALRRQDPRRSVSRWEPAKLLCQPKIHGSALLKVLTQKSFLFRIRFYDPKVPTKHIFKKISKRKTLKNDFENPSRLSPILAGSLLLLLIGFP